MITDELNIVKPKINQEQLSGDTHFIRERPSYIRTERVRPHAGAAHTGTRRYDETGKKGGLFLTGFQTALCVVCVIGAITLKQLGGTAYVNAKDFAKNAFTKGITVSQIQEALHSLRGQFPDAAEVFSSGVTTEGTVSGTSSDAPEGASSGTSSVSSAPSSAQSSSQSASSSAAKVAADITAATVGKPVQTGGEDIAATNLTLAQAKKLPPPSTVSLAAVTLSTKPDIPVIGYLSCVFGYRVNPITKKVSFHTGIDLAAPKGTPILAALSGTVEQTGVSTAYGNYIKIKDSDGIETFYGHCETILVKKGQKVSKGQKIGKVGTTGMSTGYHLHFSILKNGLYVDPQKILKI